MPSQARHMDALLNDRDGRRSLLGETTLQVEVNAYDVSGHSAVDQCCAVFLAGVRRYDLGRLVRVLQVNEDVDHVGVELGIGRVLQDL